MKKLAVALSKGGVGKTTTCVNLAAGFAGLGQKLLLVDTDTQGQVADLLGMENQDGLARVMQGRSAAEDALQEARPNLWLLSGGPELAAVRHDLAASGQEAHLAFSRAMAPFEGRFDLVLVDTAPGWDAMLINVLLYADSVLCPVACEVLALKSLVEFTRKLEQVSRFQPVNLAYVVPTFVDGRVRKTAEIMGQLRRHFGQRLCAPVRYNVKLSEAAGFGQTIWEYAPHSPGARDYQYLAERILQHDAP